jgi:glyoxylase-like metal-dependent hydrolase (beta-lactamase superfamily II)
VETIYRVTVGDLGTNCWIVPLDPSGNGGECIVADPGAEGDKITAKLAQLNLYPRYIVLTHAHFDHIAALPDLAAYQPRHSAQNSDYLTDIAVHPEEAAKLGPNSLELHRKDFQAVGASSFVDYWWENNLKRPLPEATILLNEGDTIGPFVVLHVPGHTPGSIALHWPEEKLLISGDTLFNSGVGRTDLYGGDTALLNQSLSRLFTLDEETMVCPGHGPRTTLRREKTYYS